MKTRQLIIALLAVLAIGNIANAQWTEVPSIIYLNGVSTPGSIYSTNSDRNVGIGLTNPTNDLHIKKTGEPTYFTKNENTLK